MAGYLVDKKWADEDISLMCELAANDPNRVLSINFGMPDLEGYHPRSTASICNSRWQALISKIDCLKSGETIDIEDTTTKAIVASLGGIIVIKDSDGYKRQEIKKEFYKRYAEQLLRDKQSPKAVLQMLGTGTDRASKWWLDESIDIKDRMDRLKKDYDERHQKIHNYKLDEVGWD